MWFKFNIDTNSNGWYTFFPFFHIQYLYQKVSENLTRSGQNNTTMLREFKKGRNTSMFGNKTIISNRHGYFSPRRFLFVLNLFLLIGSKIVNADQQDSSADYHDDVCSSGRDGSEAHNCKWTNKNTGTTAFFLLVSDIVLYFVLFDCIAISLSPQVQQSPRQWLKKNHLYIYKNGERCFSALRKRYYRQKSWVIFLL
jgi:hypothetical protein